MQDPDRSHQTGHKLNPRPTTARTDHRDAVTGRYSTAVDATERPHVTVPARRPNLSRATAGTRYTLGYFRDPYTPGTSVCGACGHPMHEHGWLDAMSITVCPSDVGPFGGQSVTEAGRAS